MEFEPGVVQLTVDKTHGLVVIEEENQPTEYVDSNPHSNRFKALLFLMGEIPLSSGPTGKSFVDAIKYWRKQVELDPSHSQVLTQFGRGGMARHRLRANVEVWENDVLTREINYRHTKPKTPFPKKIPSEEESTSTSPFTPIRVEGLPYTKESIDLPVHVCVFPSRPRMRTIFAMRVLGMSNRLIGERLFIAEKTVENQMHDIYDEMGIEFSYEKGRSFTAAAVRRGLVDIEPLKGLVTIPKRCWQELTGKEQYTLDLLARGLTNQNIADAMVIEVRSVENRINTILSKLELEDTRHAIIAQLLRT